jgi:hypothetical protein
MLETIVRFRFILRKYITRALLHALSNKFAKYIKPFENGYVHDRRNNLHVENEILGGRITFPLRNVVCYCLVESRAAVCTVQL